jgi:hypothetical protein
MSRSTLPNRHFGISLFYYFSVLTTYPLKSHRRACRPPVINISHHICTLAYTHTRTYNGNPRPGPRAIRISQSAWPTTPISNQFPASCVCIRRQPTLYMYAWDHAEGGIHHGLAHNACFIFADNRIDGYLSRTCDGEHGERVNAAWDDVLPAADTDYYFYVPYPPLPPSGEPRPPYRWPIVTNFQDWKFPSVTHEIWMRAYPRCRFEYRASVHLDGSDTLTRCYMPDHRI